MRVVMGISIEMQLTFGAGSNVLVCIKEELADYRKSHSRFHEGCFCVTVGPASLIWGMWDQVSDRRGRRCDPLAVGEGSTETRKPKTCRCDQAAWHDQIVLWALVRLLHLPCALKQKSEGEFGLSGPEAEIWQCPKRLTSYIRMPKKT